MAGNPFDQKKAGGTATATKARGGLAAANGDADPIAAPPRRGGGDPFALPSSGGGDYKFTEFLGELLLVRPTEAGVMPTKIDPESEFVRVDVIRLDNENEQVEDLIVFASALIRTFKAVLRGDNEWVLGRLQMGEAKNGKNAPYILTQPGSEDIALAQGVMSELGLI